MSTFTKSRLVGASLGLVYGIAYAFVALMATGGGHANWLWSLIFIIPFVGPLIYFPLMGALAGDLRPLMSKAVFAALLIAHLLCVATYTIFADGNIARDNARMWERSHEGLLMMAGFYFVGQAPLLVAFVKSLLPRRTTGLP